MVHPFPTAAAEPIRTEVCFRGVSMRFGETVALRDVSLTVAPGEFFALLGPSGSGKTTLLRIVAGFLRPTTGEVLLNGQAVGDLPPYRRAVAMVFQNYALFPHLSVRRNVAFGLEVRGVPPREIAGRVEEALSLVRLSGLEERRPHQLSGGQQQRVALARALVIRPRVLLLDEPLAAIDRKLRVEMEVELRQIQRRTGVTTIFVTHDQEEALTLADRVAILEGGSVVQVGPPREIYDRPASRFAADFLGAANVLVGTVQRVETEVQVEISPGFTVQLVDTRITHVGGKVVLAVRPERILLGGAARRQPNAFLGTVEGVVYTGPNTVYLIRLPSDITVRVVTHSEEAEGELEVGRQVWVGWTASAVRIVEQGG